MMWDPAWVTGLVDPLLTHRVDEGFRVDLLDRHEAALSGPDGLSGVVGGQVKADADATLHTGGSLEVDELGQVTDWLDRRVRIWWHTAGVKPWPLATLLCAAPSTQHTGNLTTRQVELIDKLAVLDRDKLTTPLLIPAGAVVTDHVKTQILAAGEASMAVTDSAAALGADKVWPAGISRRRVINDLLDSINYWAIHTDAYGRYVAAPYTPPRSRPSTRSFGPGTHLVSDAWGRDEDLLNVPNTVILTRQGEPDTEALVGVAQNTDPSSRFSVPNRGVIAITDTTDAVDQATIDAQASRRLVEASTPGASRVIEVAMVPAGIRDVVTHLGSLGAVNGWAAALATGALLRLDLREVA